MYWAVIIIADANPIVFECQRPETMLSISEYLCDILRIRTISGSHLNLRGHPMDPVQRSREIIFYLCRLLKA